MSAIEAVRVPPERIQNEISAALASEGLEVLAFHFVPRLRFGRRGAAIYCATIKNPVGHPQKRYFALSGLGAFGGDGAIRGLGSSPPTGELFDD